MRIALDIQSLFENNKTGIGWMIKRLVDTLIRENESELQINESPENEYQLNYFVMRNQKKKTGILKEYNNKPCHIHCCYWMLLGIYRRIWNIIPIPYSLFHGGKAEITQFFNYYIPPGVRGKTALYVYDMVLKACPETMDIRTRRLMEKELEQSCKRADMIITISEFSKREIVKYMGIAPEKIEIVPCGVDLERYHPNYTEKEVKFSIEKYGISTGYLLYLGTLEPRKNIEKLIEAYELLKKEKKSVPKLVIAGKKGWLYECIFSKVEALGLTDEVIFTGYIEDDDVPKLIKGAELFLFPSRYEGFGMPPLEAMACGTPVIASDAASLPEVVGDAGVLVNPESAEDIAEAIMTMMNDSEKRNQLRKLGIDRAQKYTWEHSAELLRECYLKIIETDI